MHSRPRGDSAAASAAAKDPPPLSRFVDLDESDDDPEDFRSVVYDEGKESVIQEFFEERNITGEELRGFELDPKRLTLM